MKSDKTLNPTISGTQTTYYINTKELEQLVPGKHSFIGYLNKILRTNMLTTVCCEHYSRDPKAFLFKNHTCLLPSDLVGQCTGNSLSLCSRYVSDYRYRKCSQLAFKIRVRLPTFSADVFASSLEVQPIVEAAS